MYICKNKFASSIYITLITSSHICTLNILKNSTIRFLNLLEGLSI